MKRKVFTGVLATLAMVLMLSCVGCASNNDGLTTSKTGDDGVVEEVFEEVIENEPAPVEEAKKEKITMVELYVDKMDKQFVNDVDETSADKTARDGMHIQRDMGYTLGTQKSGLSITSVNGLVPEDIGNSTNKMSTNREYAYRFYLEPTEGYEFSSNDADLSVYFNDTSVKPYKVRHIDGAKGIYVYISAPYVKAAEHTHAGVLKAGKNPNCTETGIKDYYECSCGKFFEDQACTKEIADVNTWKVIPVDGSVHMWSKYVEAGDYDDQKHYHKCELCHTKDEGMAHIPGDPATETTPQTCTVCGYEIAPIITHTHAGVLKAGKNPNCTETGIKDYYECSCGKNFEDQACTKEIADVNTWKVIPVDGSVHMWSKYVEAGDYDNQKHYHRCELCHTKDEGMAHIPGDPATETTPQTCTVCGYELAPIITHTHVGNLHQGTNPTCTTEGIKDYYECKCGKFFEDQACTKEIADVTTWKVIPKDSTKHDFSKDYKKESADKGKHYHVCTRCGAKDAGEAHTPGAKATETTPQTCTKCGYEISPKVAHTHNPGIHKGFAATCTKAGEKDYYVCTCGKYFTDKSCTAEITNLNSWKVIPALGHNFTTSYTKENADNSKHYHVCTRCGAKDAGAAHNPGPAATDHSTQNCTVCGRVLAGALLHEHKGELHKGYAATCVKNGEKDFYICRCGLVFEDAACKKEIAVLDSWKVIPATGHTYNKDYLEKDADANYHYHVCTQCGAKDAGQPHAPGAAATADKDQTCNVCNKVLAKATGNDTKKEEEASKEPEKPKQEETKKEEEVKPVTPTTPEVEKEDDGVLNVGFGIALGAGVAIIALVIYRRLIRKPLR